MHKPVYPLPIRRVESQQVAPQRDAHQSDLLHCSHSHILYMQHLVHEPGNTLHYFLWDQFTTDTYLRRIRLRMHEPHLQGSAFRSEFKAPRAMTGRAHTTQIHISVVLI